MAAPVDSDLKYYWGANGNPQNDTDPVGGAIDTDPVIDDAVTNNLIYSPIIGPSAKTYYGLAYRKNEATGNWNNAKLHNRCAGIAPTGSGVLNIVSTSGADTASLWVAYKHSGNWVTESITLTGALTATGLTSWDASTPWLAVLTSPPTGDLTLSVAGQTIGVFYGTANGGRSFSIGSLFSVAVASAQDAAVSATNRTGAGLTGLGSFGPANLWPGVDGRIAIPGVDLDGGHYVGYGVKLEIPANLPKPPNGLIQADIDLIGDPEA